MSYDSHTSQSPLWTGITNLNQRTTWQAAKAYAQLGFHVLPVCTPIIDDDNNLTCTHAFLNNPKQCDNIGKRALIRWGPEARAKGEGPSADEKVVDKWWSSFTRATNGPDGVTKWEPNVGVLLGESMSMWDGQDGRFTSSLVAIDLDMKEIDGEFIDGSAIFADFCSRLGLHGESAPQTLTQRTGSGGTQLIYLDPSSSEAVVKNNIGWHDCVDLKGSGGIIILPPSRHKQGNQYSWANELRPVNVGPMLASAMKTSQLTKTGRAPASRNASANGNGEASVAATRASGAREGSRDDSFRDLVYACRKQGLTAEEARQEVRQAWAKTDNPVEDYYPLEVALEKVDYTYSKAGIEVSEEATGRLPGDVDPETQHFIDLASKAIQDGFKVNGNGNGNHQTEAQAQSSFVDQVAQSLENEDYKNDTSTYTEFGIPNSNNMGESAAGFLTEAPSSVPNDPGNLIDGQVNWKTENFTDWGTGNRLLRLYRDETDGGSPWAGTEGKVIRTFDENSNFIWDTEIDPTRWRVVDKDGVYPYMDASFHDIEGIVERTVDEDIKKHGSKYIHDLKRKSVRTNLRYEFLQQREIWENPDNFDSTPHILNTANCVVDLRNGETSPHHPKYLCTQCTDTPYIKDAQKPGYAPLLEEFYETFIPDPVDVEILERLIGYCAVGFNPERLFVFIKGSTTSGKSTLIEMASKVFGDYMVPAHYSILRDSDSSKPRPDVIKAAKSRILSISEVSDRTQLHADHIKNITGGAELSARNGHSNDMQYLQARFTPVVDTNELPSIPGADQALKLRLFVYQMNRSIPEHKMDSGEKKRSLMNDQRSREAFLARAVAGAQRFYERGLKFDKSLPARYQETISETYKSLSDIPDFIEWAVESNKISVLSQEYYGNYPTGYYIKMSKLHEIYIMWAATAHQGEDRRRTLGSKSFGQAVRKFHEVRSSNGMRVVGILEVSQ